MFFKRKAPDLRAPVVRRVRDLEILSARLIRAGFAGDYHSAFHGRGIEFSQVREYQPGDDVRTIDWNVTARSGVPHVKQFIEERDLTVIIAVDISGEELKHLYMHIAGVSHSCSHHKMIYTPPALRRS